MQITTLFHALSICAYLFSQFVSQREGGGGKPQYMWYKINFDLSKLRENMINLC